MAMLLFIVKAAFLGGLAGSIRWLVDNDPDLGRALRLEIAPWE
jgi:hypothetical protein